MNAKEKIVRDAVNEIAGLYDGPPHGGYEKLEAVFSDVIEELMIEVNAEITRLRDAAHSVLK